MNLYDYPELKEDLEDLIGNDEIPMSIDEFSPAKVEELCKTFLSECNYPEIIAEHKLFGDTFLVEKLIDEMLGQVNVKGYRGDYY